MDENKKNLGYFYYVRDLDQYFCCTCLREIYYKVWLSIDQHKQDVGNTYLVLACAS